MPLVVNKATIKSRLENIWKFIVGIIPCTDSDAKSRTTAVANLGGPKGLIIEAMQLAKRDGELAGDDTGDSTSTATTPFQPVTYPAVPAKSATTPALRDRYDPIHAEQLDQRNSCLAEWIDSLLAAYRKELETKRRPWLPAKTGRWPRPKRRIVGRRSSTGVSKLRVWTRVVSISRSKLFFMLSRAMLSVDKLCARASGVSLVQME